MDNNKPKTVNALMEYLRNDKKMEIRGSSCFEAIYQKVLDDY